VGDGDGRDRPGTFSEGLVLRLGWKGSEGGLEGAAMGGEKAENGSPVVLGVIDGILKLLFPEGPTWEVLALFGRGVAAPGQPLPGGGVDGRPAIAGDKGEG
jgi:hypothetical protein